MKFLLGAVVGASVGVAGSLTVWYKTSRMLQNLTDDDKFWDRVQGLIGSPALLSLLDSLELKNFLDALEKATKRSHVAPLHVVQEVE